MGEPRRKAYATEAFHGFAGRTNGTDDDSGIEVIAGERLNDRVMAFAARVHAVKDAVRRLASGRRGERGSQKAAVSTRGTASAAFDMSLSAWRLRMHQREFTCNPAVTCPRSLLGYLVRSPVPDFFPTVIASSTSMMSHTTKSRLLRVVIMVAAFAIFHAAEQLVGSRGLPDRIDDLMHDLFTPVNGVLQSNPRLTDASLIAITGLVDVAGVGLAIGAIVSRSVRPLVGLLVLYGMRQSVEVLCELPAPGGMIWRYPGFPSLLVDYGVMGDFFFSGHTALLAYATLELATLRRWWLTALGVGGTLLVIAVIFSLRAHYTMDVFTAVIAAVLAFLAGSGVAGSLERRRAAAVEDSANRAAPR